MCTTGFFRLGNGDYLLFKNKDFGRATFDDRIVAEPKVFGVEGITTWAGTDPTLDRFSGFSIGANSHGLLVCDSNVRTLDDHHNYDDLVEIALREGSDVPSGVAAVENAVSARPYLWGNLVLIDDSTQAAIEVRSQKTAVLRPSRPTARSNHHTELGLHPHNDDRLTTLDRINSAQDRLDQASTMEDIFALLASHDQGDTGICNHLGYSTVYSYVLTHRSGSTHLTVTRGKPCESSERVTLRLPIGAAYSPSAVASFLDTYPSRRAGVR